MNENIESSYAQVQNMYERRADLIPQIWAVVKRYAQYEKSTLTEVTQLREQWANLDKLTELVKKWDISSAQISSLLTSTISQIKVTMEAYPELKADTQFTWLMTELEWSENRIRTSIKDFNDIIIWYNIKIKSFPANIFAWILGFKERQRVIPPESKDIKSAPNVDNILDLNK